MEVKDLLLQLLMAIAVPVAGTIGVLLARLINQVFLNNRNRAVAEGSKIAVLAAEDRYGSGEGQRKLEDAITSVIVKYRVPREIAEQYVRAAVTSFWGELGPKPLTPSAPTP